MVQYDGWRGINGSNTDGGTYRVSKVTNNQIALQFGGSAITWVTRTGPDQGIAKVTINGITKCLCDLYSPTPQSNVQRTFGGLSNTSHTIVVQVTGTKNARASDFNVAVDAFQWNNSVQIAQDNDRSIRFDSWLSHYDPNASNGFFIGSARQGAHTSFAFNGSGVNWITAKGPSYGKAKVFIDGIYKATVDLYAKSQQWQVVQSYSGLNAGRHTILIQVLGAKNLSSTGKNVVVDAFQAIP